MTTATRIYLAKLAGIAVFDPNGDQVGRVREVVVRFRPGNAAPRVTGLVVEITQRRRIFIPIGRVTAADIDAVVLSSGTLSLRRFEQRPGETLVLGELLDRRVHIVDSDLPGVVVDLAMEQTRTRDWLLTRVAVREQPPGFLGRRRGQLRQLEWGEITGLRNPEADQGAANLLATFESLRPADLARALKELPEKRRVEVAAALDDDRLADVLEEMPEGDQIEILESLAVERAADVLEAMDPDDAADLLAELPQNEQERLLELMEPDEAAPVRRLLVYTEGTAGSMMTSEPVVLPPDATVAEALARVRSPQLSPALAAQVFVCRPPMDTPTGRYLGIVHFQRLLREPPGDLVGGVLDTDIAPLTPEVPLPQVTRLMALYNLVAMPVVDSAGRLVGAVTVDDVLDHLLPEDWRDREHADGHVGG
ncbi:MAG TPA: CBS domain-containing protein [Mycobacteriales bacterium]|nr:CBS domain-containing protein [Mycobacteriales bacterium]